MVWSSMKMLKKKNPNAAQYKSCGAAISLVNLSEGQLQQTKKLTYMCQLSLEPFYFVAII